MTTPKPDATDPGAVRQPPARDPFPPAPPEYRATAERPAVAICLYDRARRTEQWYSLPKIRWLNKGAELVALVGHTVGDLQVAITLDVSALVEAFERAKRKPPPGGEGPGR